MFTFTFTFFLKTDMFHFVLDTMFTSFIHLFSCLADGIYEKANSCFILDIFDNPSWYQEFLYMYEGRRGLRIAVNVLIDKFVWVLLC